MTTDSGARNRAVLLQELGRRLTREFLAKDEIIRLLLLSVVAGEHMLIVGPPGTAKSALVRTLAQSLDARYFEYLLTRFSEPNELLGPVDIQAFREGSFRRRTEQMLPEAEIAFLDEIFKASSAILNSLLGLLNERRVQIGAERVDVPLLALFAASNEVPSDDSLAALLDRFLLRVRSQNLEGFHFQQLLRIGLEHEKRLLGGRSTAPSGPSGPPLLSAKDILQLRRELAGRLQFSDEFLSEYKALTAQIRSEGIFLSDRRLIKMLKLCAASALCDGRTEADVSDLFVLKYIWNTVEQADLLAGLVDPVLRRHRQHKAGPRDEQGRRAMLDELQTLRLGLQRAGELSDVQLFAKLRSLGELRAALQSDGSEESLRAVSEIDSLLDSVVSQSPVG
ncbi:MAG TPA: AAA family ATPase [Pseudomonadota bacterium]|nr:AAA family ATPase [Pseudomonadota bacterium]HNN49712.1 AAA family ATPase [Pseudomonadota bacterium]